MSSGLLSLTISIRILFWQVAQHARSGVSQYGDAGTPNKISSLKIAKPCPHSVRNSSMGEGGGERGWKLTRWVCVCVHTLALFFFYRIDYAKDCHISPSVLMLDYDSLRTVRKCTSALICWSVGWWWLCWLLPSLLFSPREHYTFHCGFQPRRRTGPYSLSPERKTTDWKRKGPYLNLSNKRRTFSLSVSKHLALVCT